MIRLTVVLALVGCAATACRSPEMREETTTVYQGQPVAVLPPESAPPPAPMSTPRPREHAPPQTESITETAPPPSTAAPPRATPRVSSLDDTAVQYPVAKPVPGKAGFVYSPFESNGTMIDVTGYSSGTKVKDPGTNKIFIVP